MRALKIAINVLLVATLVWFLVKHENTIRAGASKRDSIAYWAAGELLVHHQNPYSVPAVLALQRSQGYLGQKPLMMRPLPWSVWLFLPLGLLNVYWAWVVWTALLLASLVASIRICWKLYGDGPKPPLAFTVAAYLFAPVAGCLVGGAMGMVLLLGIVLFLSLERDHRVWAGVALLIPMAKPHIFALLWPILAVWIVTRKKWGLLGGAAAALLLATSIALAFDSQILQHYRAMMHDQAIQNEFIPALSGMIRVLFFRRFFWVQFVPLGLGFAWSAWYFWRHRRSWDWRVHGPAVLIVSLLTTPYAWMTDEVVLLPAILQAVLWLQREKLKIHSQVVILCFVLLNFLLLLILQAKVPPSTGIYFWSSLVWFGGYWYALSLSSSPQAVPQVSADLVRV
ncbi:MAG: glycosyltransferase family 87 protein [Acidobacteriota bacterium]